MPHLFMCHRAYFTKLQIGQWLSLVCSVNELLCSLYLLALSCSLFVVIFYINRCYFCLFKLRLSWLSFHSVKLLINPMISCSLFVRGTERVKIVILSQNPETFILFDKL